MRYWGYLSMHVLHSLARLVEHPQYSGQREGCPPVLQGLHQAPTAAQIRQQQILPHAMGSFTLIDKRGSYIFNYVWVPGEFLEQADFLNNVFVRGFVGRH